MLIPITCYRCSNCNRIYEEEPNKCICERTVYIVGERFGPFIILEHVDELQIKVRCILCDSTRIIAYSNIKKQKSCGCKPRIAEIIELTGETLTYRCRKCGKALTKRLPIVAYCCEDKVESTESNELDFRSLDNEF